VRAATFCTALLASIFFLLVGILFHWVDIKSWCGSEIFLSHCFLNISGHEILRRKSADKEHVLLVRSEWESNLYF
jgi:hypothetical protein